ncbi:MAG: hypothetical protein R3C49_24940, partial [Planctomycetaceae bacterium]
DLKAAKAGQIQMIVDSRTDPAIDIIQQAEILGFPVAIVCLSPDQKRFSGTESSDRFPADVPVPVVKEPDRPPR